MGSHKLSGMRFCFTGYRSKEQEQLVTDNGGIVVSSVSGTTNVVFAKKLTTGKATKALEQGCTVIGQEFAEEYLNDLINGQT